MGCYPYGIVNSNYRSKYIESSVLITGEVRCQNAHVIKRE